MMTLRLLAAGTFNHRRRLVSILSLILFTGGIASGQAKITKATIFKQIDKGNSLGFVVQIEETNLTSPENPRVVLLPSTGITQQETPAYTPTLVTMSFTASSAYVPLEVTLSYTSGPVGAAITGTDCAPDVDVVKSYFLVPEEQVSKKYGHGVAKNFDVVQISIVNKCPLPVLVPLAGISLTISKLVYHPFSLDHVTSIFSNDRAFSGPRAIFFNIVQGAATLGSAIQPFFGPGFTSGVSILGGGFTQGAAAIWKDLSAEQLQNLTSQSFQATEQIAASGGALQKSIFIPRAKKRTAAEKAGTSALRAALSSNSANPIQLEIIPVLTVGGGKSTP
jgi:hypothetical protein